MTPISIFNGILLCLLLLAAGVGNVQGKGLAVLFNFPQCSWFFDKFSGCLIFGFFVSMFKHFFNVKILEEEKRQKKIVLYDFYPHNPKIDFCLFLLARFGLKDKVDGFIRRLAMLHFPLCLQFLDGSNDGGKSRSVRVSG